VDELLAGRTALHCAVESHGKATTCKSTKSIDATDTIRLLVENGANLNKPVINRY